jgi:hypothetical protein
MAFEDFNTYTVFDPDAKGMAIDSATQVSGTTITGGGNFAMIFKDYGVAAFPANTSFIHRTSFIHETPGVARWMVPYLISKDSKLDGAVTRPLTMNEGDIAADDSLGILTQDNNWFLNSVVNGERGFLSIGALGNVRYWAEFIWNHISKTFSIIIYSDSGYSIPVTSGSIGHNTVNDKRWIQAISDFSNTAFGWSGKSFEFDLGLAPANVPPPHLFGRAVGL